MKAMRYGKKYAQNRAEGDRRPVIKNIGETGEAALP